MTQLVNQFEIGKEKGQLDLRFNNNTIQCRAAGALSAGQAVKFVDVAGGVPEVVAADDTDLVHGYVNYSLKNTSYVSGQMVEISMAGNCMNMQAGEAISVRGDVMFVAATGKVMNATGVTKCISGWALDKAATDDIIRVFIVEPKRPAA